MRSQQAYADTCPTLRNYKVCTNMHTTMCKGLLLYSLKALTRASSSDMDPHLSPALVGVLPVAGDGVVIIEEVGVGCVPEGQ